MSWWHRLWYGPEPVEVVEPEPVNEGQVRAAKTRRTKQKEIQQYINAKRRRRGAEEIKFR